MIKLKVKRLDSYGEKSKGLIGQNNPTPVFFKTRWGIHTFFMKFPIDVIILDDKNIVKILKPNLPTWRIFIWNPKFQNIIELPKGTIIEQNIQINEPLELQFKD